MSLPSKKESIIFASYIVSYGIIIAILRILLLKLNIGYAPVDYGVYRSVGSLIFLGESIYIKPPGGIFLPPGLPFVYTPFTALILSVFAFFPEPLGIFLWTFLNASAFCTIILLSWHGRNKRIILFLLVMFSFFNVSVQHFIFGQINMILVLMCLYDFLRKENKNIPKGTLIGIAAGIKLTPLLFVAFFIYAKKWKEAIFSIISGLFTIMIGGVFLPCDSYQYFGSKIFNLSSVVDLGENFATSGNSSLQGVVARIWGVRENFWVTLISVLVAIWAFWIAREFCKMNDNLAACAVLGITSCLLSPVSWLHHWIWVIPAILWSFTGTHRDRLFAAVWSVLCLAQSTDLGDLLGNHTHYFFLSELLRSSMVIMSVFWLTLMSLKIIYKQPNPENKSILIPVSNP